MKNIKAQLELEPNFPGVATPQSSEWIICIISFTNNPLTAPRGEKEDQDTEDEGKESGVNIERSPTGTKQISPISVSVARAYRLPGFATPQNSGRIA